MPRAEIATRRRTAMTATLAALAVVVAGCSSDEDEETPSACLDDSAVYLEALRAAPAEVRLEGETPISDCLTPEQEGGQLAEVGSTMIEAATALNGEARADPTGAATVQLGYLIGAVGEGADSIHADLVRRLNAAARFSPGGGGLLPAEFERTFGQGYAAGQESG
jgi:hypothetical protein